MIRLLSVDWDYFVRMPETGKAWAYDWGHNDTAMFEAEWLWQIRASECDRTGLPRPDCPWPVGGFDAWWDRFSIDRQAPIVVAESHRELWPFLVAWSRSRRGRRHQGPVDAWSYDAHHDCGYRDEDDGNGCHDWGIQILRGGGRMHVRYPEWQRDSTSRTEAGPTAPHQQRLQIGIDEDERVREPFDVVFICHSGAWSPAWLDDRFAEFLAAAPLEPAPITGGWNRREWNEDAVQELNAAHQMLTAAAHQMLTAERSER